MVKNHLLPRVRGMAAFAVGGFDQSEFVTVLVRVTIEAPYLAGARIDDACRISGHLPRVAFAARNRYVCTVKREVRFCM